MFRAVGRIGSFESVSPTINWYGKPVFRGFGRVLVPGYLPEIYAFNIGEYVPVYEDIFGRETDRRLAHDMNRSEYRDHISSFGNNLATSFSSRLINRFVANQMTHVAGTGHPKVRELARETYLRRPAGLTFDRDGILYVADADNYRVRRIDLVNMTIAIPGFNPRLEWNHKPSLFYGSPIAVATAPSGERFFTADNRVDLIEANGQLGGRLVGSRRIPRFSGDGGRPDNALLNSPSGLAVLPDGQVLIADRKNAVIRQISADRKTINTVAGNGTFVYRPVVSPTATGFDPYDIAAGPDGIAYIADFSNDRVYRFDPVRRTFALFAGTGVTGYSGDGGAATLARLNSPTGLVVTRSGELLIADYRNHRIRAVSRDGIIGTIGGNGLYASNGDGGPGLSAAIDPFRMAIAPDGSIYFSELDFHRIRRLVESAPADRLTILSGNNQRVRVNSPPPEALQVELRGGAGGGDCECSSPV